MSKYSSRSSVLVSCYYCFLLANLTGWSPGGSSGFVVLSCCDLRNYCSTKPIHNRLVVAKRLFHRCSLPSLSDHLYCKSFSELTKVPNLCDLNMCVTDSFQSNYDFVVTLTLQNKKNETTYAAVDNKKLADREDQRGRTVGLRAAWGA